MTCDPEMLFTLGDMGTMFFLAFTLGAVIMFPIERPDDDKKH